MVIKGIERGDKDLRHFTFDDGDYVVRGGKYYYKVNYGKNKLEGEYAEDEISFVECTRVIPLGGKKPKPIPELVAKMTPEVQTPTPEVPVQEPKKRGRKAKVESSGDIAPEPGVYIQVTPGMFEYTVNQFNFNDMEKLQSKLNEMGEQGWEMCGFSPYRPLFGDTHIVAVFKRKRG